MVLRKERELKLKPVDLLKIIVPKVEIYKTHIRTIKKEYIIPILPHEWPSSVIYGFLRNLFSTRYPVDISIHLDRIPDNIALGMIQKELTNIQAELMSTYETSAKYSKLLLEQQSASELRDLISARKTHLYRLTLTITVKGKNYKQAKEIADMIYSQLAAMNFKLSKGYHRVWEIHRATAPIMYPKIPYHKGRIVHTDVVTASFPFISEYLAVIGENMILYGINDLNDTPVFIDRFVLPSYNMLIFGKTGSGKSYFEKLTILRTYNVNPDVMIYAIDPLSENESVFKALNGVSIKMWQGKEIINPLDLRTAMGDVNSKVRSVIAMLETIYELSGEEKALLDVTLTELYEKNENPIMSDLIELASKEEKLHRLVSMLRIFEKGTLSFLNRETTVDFGIKPFSKGFQIVNFDLGGVPENLLGFFMTLALDYIYAYIRSEKYQDKKKLIYIDEVHHIWTHPATAEYLNWMARHTRHYKCGMTLLTQSANDAFINKHTRAIMENTQLHLLLYHDYLSEEVKKFYKFIPEEEQYIYMAHSGKGYGFSTGLLRLGAAKVPIRIYASEEEDELLQT